MKKLNKEETAALEKLAGKNSSEFMKEVLKLSPGEGLLIEKNEWKVKTKPPNMFNSGSVTRRGMKMRIRTLENGWLVTRVL